MNFPEEIPGGALEVFEPDPRAVYTLEVTAHLVEIPRHTILVYCKHGLVSPVNDPAYGSYHFNDEAIRALRRIQDLRAILGDNLDGIKMIIDLMEEVERLRAAVRFLRE